jgi:hypothetical protein
VTGDWRKLHNEELLFTENCWSNHIKEDKTSVSGRDETFSRKPEGQRLHGGFPRSRPPPPFQKPT